MSQNETPGDNPRGSGGHKGAVLGGLGVLGIGLLKAKGLGLILLKGLASFKFLYFFKSFFSMFLMIGLYTVTFGWFYAVVVVALLFIHEMGHFIFMKGMKLDPKLPIFIPFMGAYVQMTKLPPDQATNAWVAIAGPLVGGVTSVGLFYLGIVLNSRALMAAGNTGVFLNLIQLVPCKPLDGGFCVNAISKWFFIPGVGLVFALAALLKSVLLFILGLLGLYTTYRAFTRVPEPDGKIDGQTPATLSEKILIGIAYFGLIGTLGYVYMISHDELMTFLRPKF